MYCRGYMYCREYMYWKEENVEMENTEINFDADSGSALEKMDPDPNHFF